MCDRNPQGHFTPEGEIRERKRPCLQASGGWTRVEVQLGLRPPEGPGVFASHLLACALPALFSDWLFLLLHVCFLSSLLPGEEHGPPPFPGVCLLSLMIGVLGPASLSPWAEASQPSAGWGLVPTQPALWGQARGSSHGEASSTESSSLSQPRKPAGGKVLETDLQRRGPLWPANPVGDRHSQGVSPTTSSHCFV